MNEPQFLERQHKEHPNRNPMPREQVVFEAQTEPIGDYEQKNDVPYLVDLLKIRTDFKIDDNVVTQVREVDNFIKQMMSENKMRDTLISYQSILSSLFGINKSEIGFGHRTLEKIFQEVALRNKQSGKTFLKTSKEKNKKERIKNSLKRLREYAFN